MNITEINRLDLDEVKKDPKWHEEVLFHFREIVKVRILGQEDPEWRAELEFLLSRTDQKIRQVQKEIKKVV